MKNEFDNIMCSLLLNFEADVREHLWQEIENKMKEK
jgi:hypothetical protein